MPELLQPDTPDFPRVSKQARAIYRLLYEHQNQPLTMLDLRHTVDVDLDRYLWVSLAGRARRRGDLGRAGRRARAR